MLNELENKIRKAIPELRDFETPQLNHVLEYLFYHRKYNPNDKQIIYLLERYNYLESVQNQQSELIKYLNEL